MKKFIIPLLLSAAGIIILTASINYIIDPFGQFQATGINGINKHRPMIFINNSRAKAEAISHYRPRGLILGSSRSELGLDPNHPGWSRASRPVYNLALASGTMENAYRYFVHANSIQTINQIVLGLDYSMFLPNHRKRIMINESLKYAKPPLFLPQSRYTYLLYCLLSLDALKASWLTLYSQNKSSKIGHQNNRTKYEKFYYNGQRSNEKISVVTDRLGHKELFERNQKMFRRVYRLTTSAAQMATNTETSSELLAFRKFIEACVMENIDIKLYISPVHIQQLDIIEASNAWGVFESWKRILVKIIDEVNTSLQGELMLLDFSGYNSYTTESVPNMNNQQKNMKWYWEASHFKVELGNKILDTVFSRSEPMTQPSNKLGVRITMSNIEQHLANIRDQRNKYRQLKYGLHNQAQRSTTQ